jgi:hypothetical protein
MWPTWLQELLGTVAKSQVDKSRAAILKNITKRLPILVLDHKLQVATPLLILQHKNIDLLHLFKGLECSGPI